jgi:hypothetical protein
MTVLYREPNYDELELTEEFVPNLVEKLEGLNAEVREAATRLTPREARYLVDTFYQIQENRKRAANQERAVLDTEESTELLTWLKRNETAIEKNIRLLLQGYAQANVSSDWAMEIPGIGPILAAGLKAHIDITKAPTVGHIWRYAGLDPSNKWYSAMESKTLVAEILGKKAATSRKDVEKLAAQLGRNPDTLYRIATTSPKDGSERKLTKASLASALSTRPHNARLKVLTWKIGEQFMKLSTNPKDIYGKVYAVRKQQEIAWNEALKFKDQAERDIGGVSKGTEAYKAYSQGKLPAARILLRAKRYAVKLFLSHYHHVAYCQEYGVQPPKPYIFTQPDHTHFIAPPCWNDTKMEKVDYDSWNA